MTAFILQLLSCVVLCALVAGVVNLRAALRRAKSRADSWERLAVQRGEVLCEHFAEIVKLHEQIEELEGKLFRQRIRSIVREGAAAVEAQIHRKEAARLRNLIRHEDDYFVKTPRALLALPPILPLPSPSAVEQAA